MSAPKAGFLRRVLAEPLVRFAILGSALFALAAFVSEETTTAERDGAIVVDAASVRRLSAQFETTWRRTPTREELEALMQRWVEEEVMVREARALGLDRGDAIVRQRLHQKMVFLAESRAASLEPNDDELRAYMAQTPGRFELPATVSFEQVFVGASARDDQIAETLAALADGVDPAAVGASTFLPATMENATRTSVDTTFGRGVFDQLSDVAPGDWFGPVASAFGLHVVRVAGYEAAKAPPLETVRDRVASAWRANQAEASRQAFVEALIARHRIELPNVADVLEP